MQHIDKTTFFLSAEQLEITEEQRAALIEVRQRMIEGRINGDNFDYRRWPPLFLDMDGDCGCIGFHAERAMGWWWFVADQKSPIFRLFYEAGCHVTLVKACRAIDNFLTTADPQWSTMR